MKKKVAFICVTIHVDHKWQKLGPKLGSDVLEVYSAGTKEDPEVKPFPAVRGDGRSRSGYDGPLSKAIKYNAKEVDITDNHGM